MISFSLTTDKKKLGRHGLAINVDRVSGRCGRVIILILEVQGQIDCGGRWGMGNEEEDMMGRGMLAFDWALGSTGEEVKARAGDRFNQSKDDGGDGNHRLSVVETRPHTHAGKAE